ncbi:MAG: 30S ribosomal protein S18 [Patescibacteria group bacterium]
MFKKTNNRKIKKKAVRRFCYFCVNNWKDVNYQDTAILQKFVSSFLKIAPRRRSGLCAMHQRKVSNAIKRAREMSLMPYLPR